MRGLEENVQEKRDLRNERHFKREIRKRDKKAKLVFNMDEQGCHICYEADAVTKEFNFDSAH